MTSKWRYGDAWEEFPIEPGQVWGLPNGSRVAVHDIFEPLPRFMYKADLLFTDPPWNQGNLTSFYTKAARCDYRTFDDFTDVFFERVQDVGPDTCYVEIGSQFVDAWHDRLAEIYPVTQRWRALYYRRNPTNVIRGGSATIEHDFTGIDEAKIIGLVARVEKYGTIGDLCMGRGLVGLAAHEACRPFVGTELNKRRLAVLLQRLGKKGAQVRRYG